MPEVSGPKVLIVANQTIGGDELAAAVVERLARGATSFHLVVPVPPTPASSVAVSLAAVASASEFMEVPDQRVVAADRLACGLSWLRDLGATAAGEVGSIDAVRSVTTVVEREPIDEIIVSTLPRRLSRWLGQDLPRRIGRHVNVPVTVVTAATRPSRRSGDEQGHQDRTTT